MRDPIDLDGDRAPATSAALPRGDDLAAMAPSIEAQAFSVVSIFTRACSLYATHFIPLSIVAFVASLPQIVSSAVLMLAKQGGTPSHALTWSCVLIGMVGEVIAVIVVVSVVTQAARGVRIHSSREMWGTCARAAVPVLGAGILNMGLVVVGGALLVVPGLFVLAAFYVVPTVIIVERRSVIDGFKRAAELSRGHRVGCLALALVALFGAFGMTALERRLALPFTLDIGIQAATRLLVSALDCCIAVLAYIDLRAEKSPTFNSPDVIDSELAGVSG